MDRRNFLKKLGLFGAGIALSGTAFETPLRVLAQEQNASGALVSVAEGTDYQALVSTVLEPLGGMGAFVKPDYRVVVKPNMGWDRTPEQAANTHPEVVKALVQLALEAGAAQVLVFDRPCNEPRRCYANSGIQAAVESLSDGRASCVFMDERKYVPVDIAQGSSLQQFTFYKDALEADCYINAPIAKHHGSARLTLCLKNAMGVIGGNRGEIHVALGRRIADLGLVIRPTLNVLDATRVLMRNGPTGGNVSDVEVRNTLVASVDPVAVDAYATEHFFGLRPQDIESTQAAFELGLGEIDLNKIKLVYTNMAENA